MAEPGIFEVLYSCRSMRRLKPDPVPPEVLHRVLEAGTMAPSGSNRQPWGFLVVTDPDLKRQIQGLFARACAQYVAGVRGHHASRGGAVPPETARNLAATQYLSDHLAEVPVLLFPYVREYKEQVGPGIGPAGSIYPAVQNILLACRALGLGATLTGFMTAFRAELETLLGVPPDFCPVAMIPIGYPVGTFGPTRRKPVADIAHLNRWGTPFTVPAAREG